MKRALLLVIIVLGRCEILSSQTKPIDFLSTDVTLRINTSQKQVSGKAVYRFQVYQTVDSLFLDARNMRLLHSGTSKYQLKATPDKIWIYGRFVPGTIYTETIHYQAYPKQAMYFFNDQVWTQGQGKYTSHWLPSIDDVNDKMIFNISIITDKTLTALSNGVLAQTENLEDETKIWHYRMQHPMSSYLVAVAVGNFNKQTQISDSGVPIEMYFPIEDSLYATSTYRHTAAIFNFLEKEIGVPYPWQVYKQVPVRDFLYAGMENTTLTLFSSSFLVDEIGFNDKNYVNVNAHELAHQWFGNMVTAASEEHHWLQEGFATYYALLAEKAIFGNDYFYFKLTETARQLATQNEPEKGEILLSKGASSLTYYQKGAWALFALHHLLGDQPFQKAMVGYLEKHQFRSVTTEDFLKEVSRFSNLDIEEFKNDWLLNPGFPEDEAHELLYKKSQLYRSLYDLEETVTHPLTSKKEIFSSILQNPDNPYLANQVLYYLSDMDWKEVEDLYLLALKTQNVYIRQMVAYQIDEIPYSFKSEYETLLDDNSYYTIERALVNLWASFPEDRLQYLKKTASITGLQNKNVRMMWLVLNLATDEVLYEDKIRCLEELSGYTSPSHSFEIRREAFSHLFALSAFNRQNLSDLVNACLHPNWRFASFSRGMLDDLLKDANYRSLLSKLADTLPEPEQLWLYSQLNQ